MKANRKLFPDHHLIIHPSIHPSIHLFWDLDVEFEKGGKEWTTPVSSSTQSASLIGANGFVSG
jgi:hypothetical protein